MQHLVLVIALVLVLYYFNKYQEAERNVDILRNYCSRLSNECTKLKVRVKGLQSYKHDVSKTISILDNELGVINNHIQQRQHPLTSVLARINQEPLRIIVNPMTRRTLGSLEQLNVEQRGERPVEQPHVEQPHVEQPHVEQPHVEQPHVEQPHVEQPHVEQPHVEQPHVEQTHIEQPRIEESHVEQPHVEQRVESIAPLTHFDPDEAIRRSLRSQIPMEPLGVALGGLTDNDYAKYLLERGAVNG